MRNMKKSFLMSVVALLLCFAMFLGTTFAWFTDSVTSSGNKIIAGTLKLDLEMLDKTTGAWYSVKENKDPIFNYEYWEPGYTNVAFLKVENEGNLALKWQARFISDAAVSKLAEVIDVYVLPSTTELSYNNATRDLDGWQRVGTLDQLINTLSDTTYGYLTHEGDVAYLGIALHMQEDAGNEYQGIGLEAFDIQIVATQMSHEEDSFGPDYDNDAQWPEGGMNFEASQSVANIPTLYGELTEDVIIRYNDAVYAILPAGVKLADGVTELKFTGKSVENGENIILGEGDSVKSYDIHIEGIHADNQKPITVHLGAIAEKNLNDTSLKLFHEDALMTRVTSIADFEISNQYTYNPDNGVVVIYVNHFSVFSAVQATASKWEDNTVADTSWYNENGIEFTLEDVADFLGFRDLVDGGITFEGKTVKLGADIDLNNKLFNPIGGGWAYNGGKTFNGIFDGGNHTIYNINVNGWELDETGDRHSGTSMGAGLFSSIHNATIKNLAIIGAKMVVETTSIGVVVGCAQGACTFENIVVTKATLGNYQMRNGGIVGDIYVIESDNVEGEFSHTFKNIVVDSSVKLSSMWGDFDTGNGGVIGGKYGSATVKMENVTVACELDVFSDVTAAYQWYAYRRCGMLIGYTGQNSPKQATNASADFLTCVNVDVYYGDWVNYTYYQFTNQDVAWQNNYPWVRAQASPYNGPFSNVRYGNPIVGGNKINTLELAESNNTSYTPITFNQLYGGGQGVYGCNEHAGVSIVNKTTKTVFIHNNEAWNNLKLQYWFANEDDTWTTTIEGIDMSTMLLENDVYKVDLPIYVDGFKITADGENEKDFVASAVAHNGFYTLVGDHEHNFDVDGNCICGCKKVTVNIAEYATANGWENRTQINGITYNRITANSDIEITCAGGSYTGSLYGGDNWRIYQSEAGTVTITSKAGNIVSLKVTYNIDKTGILTLNGTNIDSGTLVKINDTSVTFGVGNTGSAANGQVRITDIEVIYTTALACAHNYTITETKAPTCTEGGYTATRCAECAKVLSWDDGEPATKHDYKSAVTKEETCTDNGVRTFTCSKCQASYTENIYAKGHSYGEGEITKPATCTANGVKTYTCATCGETKTEEITAAGHKFVDGKCECGEVEAVEPETTANRFYIATKRTSGNYWYMTSNLGTASTKRYQAVDSGLSTLPFSITAPKEGYVFILINNGDGTYSIQAEGVKGNNYLGWTSGNSGTLVAESDAIKFTLKNNDDGTCTLTFKNNNETRYLSLNSTSGNNYFAFYTGTQRHELVLIPVVDSDNEGSETPACEHANKTTTSTATCTEAGVETVTCDDCGEIVSTEAIEATGHSYIDGVCSVCGEKSPNVKVNANLSFANKAQRTSFSTLKQVWEQNGITFTNNKSSSSNNVADYANPVRLYAGSDIIVEVESEITKIEFDCSSSSYATTLKNSIGTVSGATVTVSSDKVTVEFSNPVDSFTIEKLTGQVRMDSITVTYTK